VTKSELAGVCKFASSSKHLLSVDSLNAYIHNKEFNPGPSDLKAHWDSIQQFAAALWN